jgi:hypothetical protein
VQIILITKFLFGPEDSNRPLSCPRRGPALTSTVPSPARRACTHPRRDAPVQRWRASFTSRSQQVVNAQGQHRACQARIMMKGEKHPGRVFSHWRSALVCGILRGGMTMGLGIFQRRDSRRVRLAHEIIGYKAARADIEGRGHMYPPPPRGSLARSCRRSRSGRSPPRRGARGAGGVSPGVRRMPSWACT